MLLVRKNRVTVVPAISLVMTVVLTAGLVHQLWVKGETIVRLLPGFVLRGVVFLAIAVLTACRLERSDERIHWARPWRRGAESIEKCAIGAKTFRARYEHLEVSLLVRGESVLTVAGLNNGPRAEAKAQRVAEALGLPLERESDATPRADASKRSRGRRGRERRKR